MMKEKFNDLRELFRLFKEGKVTTLAISQAILEIVSDSNPTISFVVVFDKRSSDLLIVAIPFHNEKVDLTTVSIIINENHAKNILKPEDAVKLLTEVVGKAQKYIKKIGKFTVKNKTHEYDLSDVAKVYVDILEDNVDLVEDALGKDIYARVEHVAKKLDKISDQIEDGELDASDVEEELRVSAAVPSMLIAKMKEIVEAHKKNVKNNEDKELTHEKLFGSKEHENPRMDTLYNRLEELSTNRTKRLEHKQYNEKTGELE